MVTEQQLADRMLMADGQVEMVAEDGTVLAATDAARDPEVDGDQ